MVVSEDFVSLDINNHTILDVNAACSRVFISKTIEIDPLVTPIWDRYECTKSLAKETKEKEC